jgi:hypothetical protein
MSARIQKALDASWRRSFDEAYGGNDPMVEDAVDYAVGPTAGEGLATRDDDVGAKLGVARHAVEAVDEELERRGATRALDTSLPARSFDFVSSSALRSIIARDYEELRSVEAGSVKGRALLAGSVIEGLLVDALEREGFNASDVEGLRFVQLVEEAAGAKLIQKRTKAAANSVRDLRNFVHPAVELREGRLRLVDANLALALMNMVLEDLTR